MINKLKMNLNLIREDFIPEETLTYSPLTSFTLNNKINNKIFQNAVKKTFNRKYKKL